ncbi:ATP-binding cassette, sub-family B, member 4, partial [Ramicandelaber brevisporus]
MLLGAVCAVGVGAAQPLMVIVFGKVMDSFIAYDRDGRTDLADASINDAIRTRCLMFGMIGLATLALSFGLFASFSVAADRQCRRIRELYYQAILRQEMGWFDAVSSGELTTRISGDVNLINEGIAEKIGYIVQNLTQFVGGFVLAFVYSWRLSLVLMASLPLLALSGAIMSKMMSGDANSGQGAYAQAGAIATEVLASIKTVMAFGAQDRELQRYEGKIDVAYKSGVRKGLVSGAGLGFMMFVMFAAYALGFWYGAKLIVEYGVSVGDVTIVFFALIIASFSIGIATPYFTALATARGAAAKVFEMIDRTSAIDSLSDDGLRPSISGRIELRGIDFHYPTRPDVPILRNFSLRIEPGQSVALVGSSGSGKSTIVGLVERFYDPAAGDVLFDGINAKDINVRHLRQQIGLVAQEPVLFGTTIFRNIVWGSSSDDYEPTRDEVERAARLANAHDFIMQLPNGYDTLVGEKGSQLSGGQRQRISIARALVRNPKILCLDEATSALDTQSERVVQDALDAAAKNRTTIMIAHRLSTIKNADAIVVMHKGEIVQVGTHNELLA